MRRLLAAGLVIFATTASPATADDYTFPATMADARILVIDSTTDIDVIRPVLQAYQSTRPGITVRYRELTTNALQVEAEQACRDHRFIADLIFSSAMDLQVKLVNDGCATPLGASLAALLPDYARWRDELFGLTFEPAVIVYNRRLIAPREAPHDHFDFLDLLRQPDRFTNQVGTYDIEQSGLGYLFATLDSQQSSTWGRLIEAMGRNRVQLFCCTAEILQRVGDGRLTFGYNVLGSYAFIEAARNPNIAVVLPSDYTLVVTRAAFVPKAARNAADAEDFLAFTQSPAGRQILGQKAWLFSPIYGATALPQQAGLPDETRQSLRPVALGPVLLSGLDRMKRRLFIRQWRQSLKVGAN
jgi:iron(III) transport system substrate-binding protein